MPTAVWFDDDWPPGFHGGVQYIDRTLLTVIIVWIVATKQFRVTRIVAEVDRQKRLAGEETSPARKSEIKLLVC